MSFDYSTLWEWMIARDAARQCKDTDHEPPYTNDPIIGEYRFCNVRREDDRGTIWIRENIREPFMGHPHLWFMLCIARQINWPDTLMQMILSNAWPSAVDFKPSDMTAALRYRKSLNQKIYTGAYMISAPATKGADKQEYICETVCGDLWRRRDAIASYLNGTPTLAGTHERLMHSNGWGVFMAYQAVVDMRFTTILAEARDVDNWAAAGPGTIRGLNRLHGRKLKAPLSQDRALREMRAIYEVAETETDISLDFSDVPNILCETDKYLRVRNGEGKPRAKYVPGRGY